MRIVNLFTSRPSTPAEEFRKSAGELRKELKQNFRAELDNKPNVFTKFVQAIHDFFEKFSDSGVLDLTDSKKKTETVHALASLYMASVGRPTEENLKQFLDAAEQEFTKKNIMFFHKGENDINKAAEEYKNLNEELKEELEFRMAYFNAQDKQGEYDDLIRRTIQEARRQKKTPKLDEESTELVRKAILQARGQKSVTPVPSPQPKLTSESVHEPHEDSVSLTQSSCTESESDEYPPSSPFGSHGIVSDELKLSNYPQHISSVKDENSEYSVQKSSHDIVMTNISEDGDGDNDLYIYTDDD